MNEPYDRSHRMDTVYLDGMQEVNGSTPLSSTFPAFCSFGDSVKFRR
jgi:hypothetical protein